MRGTAWRQSAKPPRRWGQNYLAIIDAPDDVTAGAVAIAVGSSGSLRNLRTIKLITPEEGRKVLEKAKAAKAVYAPPGAKTPAGVR
ncbi:MAG: GYD domain-containing protein [Chloroflexi bacterium]|nr:MAG: GYD domain-containing protein [Chloroflexota bacterium]